MVGLGLLLFGLLYTHAVSPDETVRHLSYGEGVAVVAVSAAHVTPTVDQEMVASATSALSPGGSPHTPYAPYDPAGGDHEGHGQHHAGGECGLGQPPQGPGAGEPCVAALSPVSSDEDSLSRPAHAHHTAARDFATPAAHAADSAILRI